MRTAISDFHFDVALKSLPFSGQRELGHDENPHATYSVGGHRGRPRSPALHGRWISGVVDERQDKRSGGHRSSRGFVDDFPVGMGIVHL